MALQRFLLISDIHGNVDGIKKLLHARYNQREKFDAIIISGDFPATTPMFLVLTYMTKNFNLSRLGYSTKVYKEELRKSFVKHQITSLTRMMKYLVKFNLPMMYIPGNVETKESVSYLQQNFPEMIFLDNNYHHFQNKIHFFGLGGSLDHHGIVCDHEFSENYFTSKCNTIEKKIQQLDMTEPLAFVFHEPPTMKLAKSDIIRMATKAKKRGYSYDFKQQAGSQDLYNLVAKYHPKFVINGHFHEYQGIREINNSVIINPGALATYYYGILQIDLFSDVKKYKMNFYKIRPSPFNFTNFLYQKRNFISTDVQFHS